MKIRGEKRPKDGNQKITSYNRIYSFKTLLFTLMRWLQRNTMLGKIVPNEIKNLFYLFLLDIRSREKLLKNKILGYYENGKMSYVNDNVKASIDFLKKPKNGFHSLDLLKIWLDCDNKYEKYFDFNGAKLPDISHNIAEMKSLLIAFQDTFLFPCLLNDCFDKALVEQLDPFMHEGPYGYVDTDFDVTVKKNDVVIDAGAWIGDFSAYAASKDAKVYAFEPVSIVYDTLIKTVLLNDNKILPVKKALGNKNGEMEITVNEFRTSGSSLYLQPFSFGKSKKEIIEILTLDEFVEKEKISKVDFIKADIEGAERYLLMGARKVLKDFAPKLAICTYHTPEDPELLEKIILDANPKYCVIHTSHKLFATAKK
jgi:FkbM family methyltransferase